MPRKEKGPRLWYRPARKNSTRRRPGVWTILDGPRQLSTGCGAEDREGAEGCLRDYLTEKHSRSIQRTGDPLQTPIADVLTLYLQDKVPTQARPVEAVQRIETLLQFWTDPETVSAALRALRKPDAFNAMLGDIRGDTCRAYVNWRTAQIWKSAKPAQTKVAPRVVTPAAARRELEDLRSAVNHHRKEGYCSQIVSVVLPERAPARDQWLSPREAAALVRAAWRTRDGLTGRPMGRHLARFILVALYTGTRAQAVCRARFTQTGDHGFMDLDRGLFYRRGADERDTRKRRPPVALPPRLLAHIRRWHKIGASDEFVVEWNGKPVQSVRKSFASAVRAAGLDESITPHVLRHTAATWLMQSGVDLWEAAGYLGMTVQTLEARYGHHHPDYQNNAVAAMNRRSTDKNGRPVSNTG